MLISLRRASRARACMCRWRSGRGLPRRWMDGCGLGGLAGKDSSAPNGATLKQFNVSILRKFEEAY